MILPRNTFDTPRRLRAIIVPADFLARYNIQEEIAHAAVTVTGVPEDAILVDVYIGYNWWHLTESQERARFRSVPHIVFLYEHETFTEIGVGEEIPEQQIILRRIYEPDPFAAL